MDRAGRQQLQRLARCLLAHRPRQTFRIHSERTRRGTYYQVVIYRSKRDLQRAARALTHGSVDVRSGQRGRFSNCAGLTHSMSAERRVRGRWHTLHLAGFMLLLDPWMGAGYVAHECFHAANYILKPEELDIRNSVEDDERMAWVTGQLVADFWSQWWRRNKQS